MGNSDSLEGPTVGRRRNFDSPSDDTDESQETSQSKQQKSNTTTNPQNDPNAFSIGHSAGADNMAFMDFFLNEKEEEQPNIWNALFNVSAETTKKIQTQFEEIITFQ